MGADSERTSRDGRLSYEDTAWWRMSRPSNVMVVDSLLFLDGAVEPATIETVVRERLLARWPVFSCRPVAAALPLRQHRWVPDRDFALSRHLDVVDLPLPGDDEVLSDLVSERMSESLPEDRPPWRITLYRGYGAGSALHVRVAHAAADGSAQVQVLLSMTDPLEPAVRPAVPAPRPATGHRDRGRRPLPALPAAVGAVTAAPAWVRAAAKLLLTPPDSGTVLHARCGRVKRVAWTRPLSLPEVRALAHENGATVNDVLLGALAGGLRRYLLERDGGLRDVRTMVPVDLRGAPPVPGEALGNRFGLVYLDLPVLEEDPRARLVEVHRRMERIKGTPEAPLSAMVLSAMGAAGPLGDRVVVATFSPKASAVVTDVIGPAQPLALAGVPLRHLVAWVPRAGDIPLGVSFVSMRGELVVGLATDARVVPDPTRLLDAVVAELAVLAPTTSLANLEPRPR
ncbi:MAG: WS/DGAT domain-containing protein [Motilibacteraceae bacterium]